ncbi:hypothetical protein [Streptomyces sp.]|uniref:hypothetical protein n=1 Tax=Streptomyces sp. TaxID=1931 RepID=UPI002810BA04|nr:hypothetical protein [Streptomyces sp.]
MRALDTTAFALQALAAPRPAAATTSGPAAEATANLSALSPLSGPPAVRGRGTGLRATAQRPIPRGSRAKAARPLHRAPRRTF